MNPLQLGQNGFHFPNNIFEYIILNKKHYVFIKISLECVSKGSINNMSPLVQVMAWHNFVDKNN